MPLECYLFPVLFTPYHLGLFPASATAEFLKHFWQVLQTSICETLSKISVDPALGGLVKPFPFCLLFSQELRLASGLSVCTQIPNMPSLCSVFVSSGGRWWGWTLLFYEPNTPKFSSCVSAQDAGLYVGSLTHSWVVSYAFQSMIAVEWRWNLGLIEAAAAAIHHFLPGQ